MATHVNHGCTVVVTGRYTEKPNRYRIFGQTDTETDVGIQQTENTEKPTEKKLIVLDISVFINSQW